MKFCWKSNGIIHLLLKSIKKLILFGFVTFLKIEKNAVKTETSACYKNILNRNLNLNVILPDKNM